MSEPNEREILARLESTIDWDTQGIIEREDETLISLDTACSDLVFAYESHLAAMDLTSLKGHDFSRAFMQVAERLRRDYQEIPELSPGTIVQTRNEGLCIVFDDTQQMNQLVGLTNETRVRGAIAGLHVYPVLTDYALITGQHATRDAYEPRLCVVLEQSNIGDFDDIQTEFGVVAIPLQSGDGIHLDRVIAR